MSTSLPYGEGPSPSDKPAASEPSSSEPTQPKDLSVLDVAAKEFFASIASLVHQPQVELEVRLTYPRWVPSHPPLRGRGRDSFKRGRDEPPMRIAVTPAVHEKDFQLILQHLRETVKDAEVKTSVTEDVNTKEGRMSFAIGDDGSSTFTKSIQKNKLMVKDISLPDDQFPYNIRIALSKELEEERNSEKKTSPPVLSELQGYRRRKNRTSIHSGPFVYDLTAVSASKDTQTYEVEIEFCGNSISDASLPKEDSKEKPGTAAASEITEEIVRDLLCRARELVELQGLVGMKSNSNAPSSEKRGPHRPPPQPQNC